jgi:hypothetical protein
MPVGAAKMAINPNPITDPKRGGGGLQVSYQVAGMDKPRHGILDGWSRNADQMFVLFDGDMLDTLVDIYDCQWGVQPSWINTET